MPRCLISLGSNVGERRATLDGAVTMLQRDNRLSGLTVSRWHETLPIGGPTGQPAFLNGAAAFDASLSPAKLLAVLQDIENQFGRTRDVRWGPRTLDLDLLLYGEETVDTPTLQVPHPRLAFRRFVLEPAAEVAGTMLHPRLWGSIDDLLHNLNRTKYYVAVAGFPGSGKTRLAQELVRQLGGRLLPDPAADFATQVTTRGSAGHGLEREIEFLNLRRQSLLAADWPADGQLTVSDFSWDQTLAYGDVLLVRSEQLRLHEESSHQSTGMVAPRLTILLDPFDQPPVAVEPTRGQSGREWTSRDLRRLAGSLQAYCRGLVLRLPYNEWERTLAEAVAAVAAIR